MILARNRSPNRDKAFRIFKRHKGNISNKELAEILQEDPKTISKWKALDEWEKKSGYSKQNDKNSKNKKINASTNATIEEDTIDMDMEKQLNEIQKIEELNEKHLLFCIYYIQCFNATKAYQKTYQCSKTTAMVNGCKLLSKTNIQIAIAKLKQNRLNRAMLKPEDIFQKYMDIAFSDITDYITFGKMDVEVGNDVNGLKIYQKINYIDYKDSEEIDGTLISEFKEGNNGFSIKLLDKMKALNWLADHSDLATEEQKTRVDTMKKKQKLSEEQFIHEKDVDSKKYW